jgi:response regulator NasT
MNAEKREPGIKSDERVFVVEDESLVAVGLQSMLARLGYLRVRVFATAEEALAKLELERPTLILMDIKLGPGMDGLAAAREVMERRPCPVIITTAYAEEKYLQGAMQSHVFGYLVKPITVQQLASAIALAKGRFAEFERLRAENQSLRETLETRKLVERAKGILMEKRPLTEQQAYELLRSQSQEQSRPMGEIARRVIEAAEFL